MRTLQIGQLNKRVTFKRLTAVSDIMGQDSQQLEDICTVWASLYPVRGAEFHELQKVESKITHKGYVRYSALTKNIDANDLIYYGEKTYQITSVVDVDLDHKYLEIYCCEYINKEGY